jgi:hypothetical protein
MSATLQRRACLLLCDAEKLKLSSEGGGAVSKVSAFSHGQLHVALSRITTKEKVKMKIIDTKLQGKVTNNNYIFTFNFNYKGHFIIFYDFNETHTKIRLQ